MKSYPLINIIGIQTLILKETRRFLKVSVQTIAAPVISTLLFYLVFSVALGGDLQKIGPDIPFMTFLAPGLIVMGMVQNAFSNTSSSLLISKMQNIMSDVLMAPLRPMELTFCYMVGGVLRGVIVGIASIATIYLVHPLPLHNIWAILYFGVMGSMALALTGTVAGIMANKIDQLAGFTTFVITPLTFLSGTFYTVDRLPIFFQKLIHLNPFFYIIDGFRSGFIGHADSNLMVGVVYLLVINALLIALNYGVFKTGYKLKS